MKRGIVAGLALTAGLALVGAVLPVPGIATAQERAPEGEAQQEREAERQEQEAEGRVRERRRAIVRAMPSITPAGQAGSYLGVRIRDVDAEAVERLGLREERGALVTEVVEETPAAEAGLREDDVIVGWNGTRVESVAQLQRHLRETPPGRAVTLRVVRDGAERDVRAEVAEPERGFRGALRVSPRMTPEMRERVRERMAERPRADRLRPTPAPPPVAFERMTLAMRGGRMGVTLQGLTDQLREHFGVAEGRGALVGAVSEDSPAARAGLRAGDVIISVGGEPVDGPGDVARAVRGRDAGPVEVRIVRDRQERTLTVELEEARGPQSFFFEPGTLHVEPGAVHVEPFRVAVPEVEVEAFVPDPDAWRGWAEGWQDWAGGWEDVEAAWGEWARELGESLRDGLQELEVEPDGPRELEVELDGREPRAPAVEAMRSAIAL